MWRMKSSHGWPDCTSSSSAGIAISFRFSAFRAGRSSHAYQPSSYFRTLSKPRKKSPPNPTRTDAYPASRRLSITNRRMFQGRSGMVAWLRGDLRRLYLLEDELPAAFLGHRAEEIEEGFCILEWDSFGGDTLLALRDQHAGLDSISRYI